MRVGYLGPEGTFSEEAGKLYKKKLGSHVELVSYSSMHELLLAVANGKIQEGVLPIENSVEGTIGAVTDALAREVDLNIVQEIVIPIYHNLMAQKGVHLREVTDVISHPQPLDQCSEFIRKKMPGVKLHFSHSTSEAASQVAKSLGQKIVAHGKTVGQVFAAISTEAAAKLYGLNILAKNINPKDNQTRFVALAKKSHPRTGRDKTSIVFSMRKDFPGSLYEVLGEFAKRKINLTRIESRPSKKALGDYYFFIDLEGHCQDAQVSDALKNIKSKTTFLKLLGSYPKA